MRATMAALLPLAHQTQTQHGDPTWARIGLVVSIAALVGGAIYLIVSERTDRATLGSSEGPQRRNAITARIAQRRHFFAGIVILAFAGAITSGISVFQSHTTDAASEAITVVQPDPTDPYPFEITAATATGLVDGRVRNKTNDEVVVQCSIEALGAAGKSVLTGMWRAYNRSGKEIEVPVYTTWFRLEPRTSTRFGVELAPRLKGPVATLDTSCKKRPPLE